MTTSVLGSLAHALPEEAKKRILAAITRTKGDRKAAAALLGAKVRGFYRIIGRLEMWPEIDQLIADRGFVVSRGPPRRSDRAKTKRRRAA